MAEKKEKGNAFKIIIIVLLVLIVFGLGFTGWMLVNNKNSSDNKQAEPTANTLNNPMDEISSKTYSLDEFLVNLADKGEARYFKVKIFIGYEPTKKKEKDMESELESKKPILRDSVNSILRAKKTTDLYTQKNIDDLKKEILARVSPYFENGKVNNVYFNEILIQ